MVNNIANISATAHNLMELVMVKLIFNRWQQASQNLTDKLW